MRISYGELFSVECLHGYFADRVCKALTLRPTAACDRMLQRYRLLFRPSIGGGTVYSSEPDLLQLYREVTPFAFVLTSTDPLLDIYTESDVPKGASPSDTVCYFSNRKEYPADNYVQPRLLLHPVEKPFGQAPPQVRGSMFTYHFEQPVRATKLRVSDTLLSQLVWEAQTPTQEVGAWTIDLRGKPCGYYQLSIGDNAVLDFYLSDTPAVRQWGVVEIFAGGPELARHIPTVCQVIDAAGRLESRRFVIELGARKTVWRYYIFDQSQQGSAYEGYQVGGLIKRQASVGVQGEKEIRFNRQTGTVTRSGRQGVVFESEQAVALCESPSADGYLFTCKANGRSERGGRSINLPFAQPGATRLEAATAGLRMCSEIFVYL